MFKITKDTKEETGQKFFAIDSIKDFVQEDCFITDMIVEEGQYGTQLKVTVGKEGASTSGWLAKKPEADVTLPSGKVLTNEAQIKNASSTIAHICRKYLGEDLVVEGTTFEEVCNSMIAQTKDKWATTPLRVKFMLKATGKGNFANLAKYLPIFENMSVDKEKSKLKITLTDKAAFNAATGIIPDTDDVLDTNTTDDVLSAVSYTHLTLPTKRIV